ncbi:hypothetical protein RJ639_019216 [Escallonia herrerae]|uniref:Reverse transcriptase Ty1/copia-type domain-containing protein n=1 Tax=Escallonia herrerae TaxID=1293975 RepID=A0AA88V8F4_9ASTE|nr:hypothetical protein RJ639_019216 [Escallonia herrerae]
MFDDFKKEMTKEFEMTDIGLMSYYLGIEVKQRDNGTFISQEAYAKEVLKRFNMKNCNPIISVYAILELIHALGPSKQGNRFNKKGQNTIFSHIVINTTVISELIHALSRPREIYCGINESPTEGGIRKPTFVYLLPSLAN